MSSHKRTLIIGASTNPSRYSYKATASLKKAGHEVVPFGIKKGNIEDLAILNHFPEGEAFHTVTLYLRPSLQEHYYQSIIDLKPSRVIFNPGTENPAFQKMLKEKGIYTEQACTLVLISIEKY